MSKRIPILLKMIAVLLVLTVIPLGLLGYLAIGDAKEIGYKAADDAEQMGKESMEKVIG